MLEYYHRWCDTNGVMFKPDRRWLSKEMQQRGYEKKRSGGSWWLGIEVLPEVIDELSHSNSDNGQVQNCQTHTGHGNGQVGQVDSLYVREEGNLSDNGFHLSTCPNVETFNSFDLDKSLDILVRQYWSAGAKRQDLSFEEFAAGESGYLSSLSGNELSDQFSGNLDFF
ncbi:MAG: hypothetical protein QGI86_04955 [Candidatus Poribacteria bacterium]|nr:hypothetical protein [Candidatus Poribacteria bacterium]MDP6749653.1 hypothetical protein [Candidatus Poribacteria bacterium]MDP6995986.1 hypothetical protein [Candidatus Poribacteria bacterium]